MSLKARNLIPVFAPIWVCVAVIAIWQTDIRGNDAVSSITAGLLLVASLLFSRYILHIPFSSGPMVYLILLGLFHLGLIVPWALGIYDISRAPSFSPYRLSHAIALIDYAIAAFQVGIVLALSFSKRSWILASQAGLESENVEVYSAGCLLLTLGIVMFIVGLVGLDPLGYFRLSYSETFRLRAESDPRLFGSGITIAFIGLSIAAAGASFRRFRIVSAVGAIWLGSLLYWGFRGPALIAGIIVYIIARKKGLRVPYWVTLLAAVCLLVVIPVLRVGRELPFQERFARDSYNDFNILDGPAEMGMSLRPLVETVDVLSPKDFRLGKTYWIGIKGIVPNLALHWESSSTESEGDLPPNHWITSIVDPWAYKNYGGIGFSAVAEPYMNFGLTGVIIYFLCLSFLLVYIEQLSIRNSYSLAAWALILGPLIWTTRNDFTNFFRPAVWGLLTLAAVKGVSRIYSKAFAKRKPRSIMPVAPQLRAKGE
jgi:O-antigen polysaccharide polymerase Wzy